MTQKTISKYFSNFLFQRLWSAQAWKPDWHYLNINGTDMDSRKSSFLNLCEIIPWARKHLSVCPMSSLAHPALLVPSGLLICCENSRHRDSYPGTTSPHLCRGQVGAWEAEEGARADRSLHSLSCSRLESSCHWDWLWCGQERVAPTPPASRGRHTVLTVKSSFKSDAQTSLGQHRDT